MSANTLTIQSESCDGSSTPAVFHTKLRETSFKRSAFGAACLSAQPIQSAIRIAAVIHAVAVALEQADVAG